MTIAVSRTRNIVSSDCEIPPGVSRVALVTMTATAIGASFIAANGADAAAAISDAGADLTRLLRFMALLKAAMAVGAVAAVLWRLGSPITPIRLAAYAIACTAMMAGPCLIWTMAHVGLGALLLHGGLVATILLLWRDPALADRLAATVAFRRRPE